MTHRSSIGTQSDRGGLSAPLARLEATVLARRFAARFPGARFPAAGLAGVAAVWGGNLSYAGLDHLYVEWDAAAGSRRRRPGENRI